MSDDKAPLLRMMQKLNSSSRWSWFPLSDGSFGKSPENQDTDNDLDRGDNHRDKHGAQISDAGEIADA
ncbi:hypothetical protein [Bifidobacterium scaligerum]|nr:hypothetical protein [Bifidobacterium scaligerum]